MHIYVSRYIFKNSQKAGLQELGPRFTLKLRSLQRGTFDTKFGQYEWIHKVNDITRSHCGLINNAEKRILISPIL